MRSTAAKSSPPEASTALTAVDDVLVRALARHRDDPDFWSLKTRDRTDSAHCVFQYPAMMVPLVQRRLLAAVIEAQPNIKSLYDPFVGSGTSLVSGMHFALNVYGTDINPLAVLISRVRTARKVEFTIGAIGADVVKRARADRRSGIDTTLSNRDKWFKPEVLTELSRLRRSIRACEDLWVRRFLWVTLAETVRLTSNDRTSTYKLHARPVEEIEARNVSPIDVFADLVSRNADSFAFFRKKLRDAGAISNARYRGAAEIALADTRESKTYWADVAPFDLMMTSPPYGDNQTTVTYGQHSYLPLNWIDLADIDPNVDAEMLRTTLEIDRRSLGGRDPVSEEEEEQLFAGSPTLKNFVAALPARPIDGRLRLVRFYRDFRASLETMIAQVRQNSYMIWTVGNRSIAGKQVPTDAVLSELMEDAKCATVTMLTRRIHHKRMPDRNASSATMREEKILLLRKL
ncbi:hypothetical protein [Rhizorhabdus dicambivorans]|uniref:site-specific DNA-methyltransferase (cytosine-N(4)-specific) n=1 Tax=Rhizorhabdus dicambivorans TaxID=1850238 RepID=A0A2A4FNK9_9SPHN|nr:hypothetical protein [Rhizorhabdus dicambivorans]PCE39679.1 hypothetical protein COO09_24280 [Rhizorhabdus dicambivorans]